MLPIFWIFLGTPRSPTPISRSERSMSLKNRSNTAWLNARICLALGAQAAEQQRQMQADHVEAAGDGVGHAPVGVETRLPGLRHNGAIDGVNRFGSSVFAEQGQDHACASRRDRMGSGCGVFLAA